MTSKAVSVAVGFLVIWGQGVAAQPPTSSIDRLAPVIDIAAGRVAIGATETDPSGGKAAPVEFDGNPPSDAMSRWFWLAYLHGGNRLQVFAHTSSADPAGTEAEMAHSQHVAWELATATTSLADGTNDTEDLPRWAHVRTGRITGPSAGLMFTLAYIDALTPGALAGDLRIAGTGAIGADGLVMPVAGVDVKVAVARLTRPDVIFTPLAPASTDGVTIIESEHTRFPTQGAAIGRLLNLSGYADAGRTAATHPGTTAVVVVHDFRQALAWLCGRTSQVGACAAARASTSIAIGTT